MKNIMTKRTYLTIFECSLSIYRIKIAFSYLRKTIWRILFEKVPKNLKNFSLLIFSKSITDDDPFKIMDKGGQNSCSLREKFLFLAPFSLPF